MKALVILLLLSAGACGRHADARIGGESSKSGAATGAAALQSMLSGKSTSPMKLIPIPTDRAQLNRLLAAGYTIHKDHMHPPGVKSCPLDKNSGGVVE